MKAKRAYLKPTTISAKDLKMIDSWVRPFLKLCKSFDKVSGSDKKVLLAKQHLSKALDYAQDAVVEAYAKKVKLKRK